MLKSVNTISNELIVRACGVLEFRLNYILENKM